MMSMGTFGVLVAVSAVIALAAIMGVAKHAGYDSASQLVYLNYSYLQEVSALGLSASACSAMDANSIIEFYNALNASAKLDGLNASMHGNIITIYKDSYPNIYRIVDCG